MPTLIISHISDLYNNALRWPGVNHCVLPSTFDDDGFVAFCEARMLGKCCQSVDNSLWSQNGDVGPELTHRLDLFPWYTSEMCGGRR